MYLKSLVLKGFKSFADRSQLTLEPGLTVVVGPNGSGKSNISDAVLWVLGEQSAKQLRGASMEDVIFAGSSARKAVSLAEVDLVLDNSDGTLALDFSEVAITRRMYRSGESEYLINGSPARLMDVLDILNDSGLGRDAHSIISQGSLQDVLQARSQDRRTLIEEAAGILKHKKRKERCARKLKNMSGEVQRVHDIMKEIERQLKPLERQASRAKQHAELADRLFELELSLAVDDLRQLQGSWDDAVRVEKEADAAVELARFRMDEKSAELEKVQRLLEEKGLFVGDINEQRRRCQLVVQRLDSGMLLLEEKGRHMVTRLSELRQAIHRSSTRAGEAAEELDAYEDEQRDTVAKREALTARVAELKHEADEVRRERKGLDEQIGRLNSQIRSRSKALEQAQLQAMKANESLSTADVEDELLVRRAKQVEDNLVSTKGTLAQRRVRVDEVAAQLTKLAAESKLAKSDIDKRVRLLDDARAAVERCQGELASLQARRKAIEEIDRAFESASPLRAWVSEHPEQAEGVVAPVNELFEVPADLEQLVETLLGGDVFGLMLEDCAAAGKLARTLLEHVSGEGGEISLFSLKGDVPERNRAAYGVRLIGSLKFPQAYERVAELLLGDVYVVDSVADAVNASLRDTTGARFATRQGVVAWPNGKLTLGAHTGDTEGVLSRKRQLNALADELPVAESALAEATEAAQLAEHNLQLAQGDDFEIAQQAAQLSGEKDSLISETARLEQTITALMAENEEIEHRRTKIADDSLAARQLSRDLAERQKTLEAEKAGFEEELAKARDVRSGYFERENTLSHDISEAQVELATVREREHHLNKQVTKLQREKADIDRSLTVSHDTEASLEILRLRVEPLYGVFTELREQVMRTAELLRDRASLEQAGQGDLRQTIEDLRGNVAACQRKLDEATESLNATRIEKSKLEVRVEQAIAVITQKHGVILDLALDIPAPPDRAATEAEVEKLQRKLKTIGAVNPVAVEEYRSLKERHDFIAMQLDDLAGAQKALQRIVNAIDRKMRNRFLETFEQVNTNFGSVFSELFPGGTGYLELTDPENPAETGVEVHAQPRGKAVRKQSLLSGGEQSLTALALLFAVYQVRQTPFFILDEVEAALDDTNLRRLLAYLDKLRDTTQLIMVSHQRRTMEMADLLYGVSMRSDGVSKLVSQKLDAAVRLSNARPVADIDEFSGAQ